MTRRSSGTKARAFTLIELLVVIGIVLILLALIFPVDHGQSTLRARRIQCVNNLYHVGYAFRVWTDDQRIRFPMEVSTNKGGTAELIEGPNAWRHFAVMSNELATPRILFCPADYGRRENLAITFRDTPGQIVFASNTNLSYFVGVDAKDSVPQMFLVGDRNITNGTALKNSILELITNQPAGWTGEMHIRRGNVGFADGSVQALSSSALRTALEQALEQTGTNNTRLAMP